MVISLDEWTEKNGWKKFEDEVRTHVESMADADEETVEIITRCIMTSLRQEVETKKR